MRTKNPQETEGCGDSDTGTTTGSDPPTAPRVHHKCFRRDARALHQTAEIKTNRRFNLITGLCKHITVKTGKENKPPGNIHRQQLFYWMGGSLDKKNGKRKVFSDALVKECLAQLRGSLENGLWVKSPRFPEQFEFNGKHFALDAAIACFTEWSLGESLPHTTEYGRVGLGFPKRWVIERGGQSVTYFRHNEKGSFLKCVFALPDELGQDQGDGLWTNKPDRRGFEEFRYLLHFAKMIRL